MSKRNWKRDDKVIKKGKKDWHHPIISKARDCLRQRNFDKAKQFLDKVVPSEITNCFIRTNYYLCLVQIKARIDDEYQIRLLEELLDSGQNINHTDVMKSLVYVNNRLQRKVEALTWCYEVLQIQPDDEAMIKFLGKAHEREIAQKQAIRESCLEVPRDFRRASKNRIWDDLGARTPADRTSGLVVKL